MSGIHSHPNREQMRVPLIRCIASLAPTCMICLGPAWCLAAWTHRPDGGL